MRKIHLNSYAKSSQNVTGGEVSQTVMLKLRKSFERIKNDIGTRESDANIQVFKRIKIRFNSTVNNYMIERFQKILQKLDIVN